MDQSSNKRRNQFGRRTVSIIDTLQDEMSQQTIRFKSVVSKSKWLKELVKEKKNGQIVFGVGRSETSKKEQVPKDKVICTQIDIGSGWYKAIIGVEKKVIYFNSETGSVNDTYPFGLKDGYVMMLDDATGDFYYVNQETGDTTWERPQRDAED